MNLPEETTSMSTPPRDHTTELEDHSNIRHNYPELAFISLKLL